MIIIIVILWDNFCFSGNIIVWNFFKEMMVKVKIFEVKVVIRE